MRGVFIGLTTLDLIHYVENFPHPDEKIQAQGRWMGAGGPAANAAVAFAALGGRAELITALGSSPAAQIARHDLEQLSVEVCDLADEGEIAISNIVVDDRGQRTVVSFNGAGFGELRAVDRLDQLPDVVLTDGHHVPAALPILDQALDGGCPTLLDAGSRKPGTDDLLKRTQLVIASSAFAPDRTAAELAADLLVSPVRMAAVSRGAESVVGLTEKGPFEVEVPAVEAVDTLGAGDVLHGAFAHALVASHDPVGALQEAVVVASQACTIRGPRLPR